MVCAMVSELIDLGLSPGWGSSFVFLGRTGRYIKWVWANCQPGNLTKCWGEPAMRQHLSTSPYRNCEN